MTSSSLRSRISAELAFVARSCCIFSNIYRKVIFLFPKRLMKEVYGRFLDINIPRVKWNPISKQFVFLQEIISNRRTCSQEYLCFD